jgi:hypothetical protein
MTRLASVRMEAAMSTDDTEGKQSNLTPFKPGQSGNPAGRPKGARSKLGEAFLDDLLQAWEREGAAAIQRVIDTKPAAFLKVVADILPKELKVERDPLEDLTDEQLLARLEHVRALNDRARGRG